MEFDSLRQEVTQLKSEKAALDTKSKLLENFAAMAYTCCRLPSSAGWKSLIDTLRKTLAFSIELTGAHIGSLVLVDRRGHVSDSIRIPGDRDPNAGLQSEVWLAAEGLSDWVRHHRQVGLIADTLDDNRWRRLPDTPQSVRSVLAVPVLKCDTLLGILTLMHANPNQFSPEIVAQMEATSNQIAQTIENARLYAQLDESYQSLERSKQEIQAYSKALDEELEKGRQIQNDFLPRKIPRLPNWEIETYFAPAKQVSGDFYDVFSLPGKNLGLVIADVADKGVGSALYMALIRSLIRVFSGHISLHGFSNFSVNNGITETVRTQTATAEQLGALNAVKLTNDYIAHEHSKEGMFATLFFGVINPLSSVLAYINGGHEPLYIVNSAGVTKRLDPTGPAVGMMPEMKFKIGQLQIDAGDVLIGYTDGVIEALAPNGEFFTRKRLLSILKQQPTTALDLVERIKANLTTHVHSAPPSDDITMLAVQRLP